LRPDKVGYALRAAMLQHFIAAGIKRYDFLGGLATHKQKWGCGARRLLNLRLQGHGASEVATSLSQTSRDQE